MGETTEIAWTDHTFNPWVGCSKVSPGCSNCYAEVDTFARASRAKGLELWGPKAARHVTSESYWKQPLKWDRAAARDGVRRRVFCASLSDVFEDREDLRAPRARLFMLINETPSLDWLLLTKRPENAARLWERSRRDAQHALGLRDEMYTRVWAPNVWLGTTCEDQERADERLPDLLSVPAHVHYVSYEPAIGPVDFAPWLRKHATTDVGDCTSWCEACALRDHVRAARDSSLDWIIVGGESGSKARPFDLAWARSTLEQCNAARVACFVKQLGARPMDGSDCAMCGQPMLPAGVTKLPNEYDHASGCPANGRWKGGDMSEWPADLRVREFPGVPR